MARRELLQPVAYQAERRQLARERRETFLEPPTRRNRVWQFDFERHEAPLLRAEVKGLRRRPVAAGW